jgi:hypothetical protein
MRQWVTCLVVLVGLVFCPASPASAQITGDGNGYIDSPNSGATFNRAPGQPYVLVDFKASGMEVWLEGAQPNEQMIVKWEFVLLVGASNPPTSILAGDPDNGKLVFIQADGNGDWQRWAKDGDPDQGKLERLGYGVGPGGWYAGIKCELVKHGGGTIADFHHEHSFTVN